MIEEHVSEITGLRKCGEWAREALSRTSHLVKARSVAYAASFCVYAARLAEAMGVTGFWHSMLPGKGSIVHKLLAIAFPLMILENRDRLAEGSWHSLLRDPTDYVREAEERLDDAGIPVRGEADWRVVDAARKDAAAMLKHAARFVSEASKCIGLDLAGARVYSEMQLMSYRLHVWGVLDALVEEFRRLVGEVRELRSLVRDLAEGLSEVKLYLSPARVEPARPCEAFSLEELPSYFKDNPWLDILRCRGRG